jgi:hypothetical protein
MKNQQSVFYIEVFISPYDGVIPQGIASSLEKAVEFCKDKIKKGEETHTDDPYKYGGLVITEFIIDNFNLNRMKHYNDEGVLLKV